MEEIKNIVIIIFYALIIISFGYSIYLFYRNKKKYGIKWDSQKNAYIIKNYEKTTDNEFEYINNNISFDKIINENIEKLIEILAYIKDGNFEYIDYNTECNEKNKLKIILDDLMKYKINSNFVGYDTYIEGIECLNNFSKLVNESNKKYLEYEKNESDYMLSNINGRSLDDQQRNAVIVDEVHNLIVAGAGSGKTLTIVGKVKYLVYRKHIDPNEILLITFTKKAADEMSERINKELKVPVKAMTFHKLGIDIYTNVIGKRPDVYTDLPNFVYKEILNQIKTDNAILNKLMEFFAYYISIIQNPNDYETYGDYITAEKEFNIETLKMKYIKAKKKGDLRSLAGEKVHSVQEVIIANFFFLNGIKYEYEKEYPYRNNVLRKKYRPDFYLPEYDIYWEHFAVDENMHCNLNERDEDNIKYELDMEWKRSWHKVNGTKLVESYAYFAKDNLPDKLKEICRLNKIELKPINRKILFNSVYARNTERTFSSFLKLISSFILLFKANAYDINKFDKIKNDALLSDKFIRKRTELFIEIVKPIYESYSNFLNDNDMIDFSDMIIKATEFINADRISMPYKYVIIDEYQDMGMDRYHLVKAILNSTGAKLMCVGDDWQSIYRFAGSDISLFTNFNKYWGKSKIIKLEKTYRNSQQLIDIAGKFVMKNPIQIKKDLKSDKYCIDPIHAIYLENDINLGHAVKIAIDDIINKCGTNTTVFLLGRTSYDFEMLCRDDEVSSYFKFHYNKVIYSNAPNMDINFFTIHKSKGLEADNVILLNLGNDVLGFPNKISDDPLLSYVLNKNETYLYDEERRLFYVAMTRTRNRIYLLLRPHNESLFYFEIEDSVKFLQSADKKYRKYRKCPKCKRGNLIFRTNKNNNNKFYGCTNYPYCDYTSSLANNFDGNKNINDDEYEDHNNAMAIERLIQLQQKLNK